MLLQMGQVLGGEGLQLSVVTLRGVPLKQIDRVFVTRDLVALVLLGELVTLEAFQLVELALMRAV